VRAGSAGTRTSGSEGGPGKRTLRKEHTAPWPDPYTIARLQGHRRLRVRYERRADIHEAFLQIAGCLICFKLLQAEESFC
jgi:hypothetical protein